VYSGRFAGADAFTRGATMARHHHSMRPNPGPSMEPWGCVRGRERREGDRAHVDLVGGSGRLLRGGRVAIVKVFARAAKADGVAFVEVELLIWLGLKIVVGYCRCPV
jgi:hypothetical protein